MDDREKTVQVIVFGQECVIRGDADADYMREIAAFVDERMREGRVAQPSVPPLKVAILTALNIADELFSCRREKEEIIARVENKAREFSDNLNQGLA
jgi:cell division protein ZapA